MGITGWGMDTTEKTTLGKAEQTTDCSYYAITHLSWPFVPAALT
jgi:hypothetical protein